MKNIFYFFLKKYCRVALHFFFRQWQIQGAENIPSGPVIFVPNHQNAFLDAIIVTCSTAHNPWFVTRSDVFKHPYAKWILSKLQMLPVFRFRDGYKTLKQNDGALNECINKINSGNSLLIFAEGNHGEKYQLRPFQKGFARIALSVNTEVQLRIIPVGIQYESSKCFGTRVLVNFGLPINVADYTNEDISSRKNYEGLLLRVYENLKKNIIHIDEEFYDAKINYLTKHRVYNENLVEQLRHDQLALVNFPVEKLNLQVVSHISVIQKIFNGYTMLNIALPSVIINKFIITHIQDPQFDASIKFASGLILVPLCWLIQSCFILLFTESYFLASIYLISLPIAMRFTKK